MYPGIPWMMMGDWNVAHFEWDCDSRLQIPYTGGVMEGDQIPGNMPFERKHINQLIKENDFADAFQILHPQSYTDGSTRGTWVPINPRVDPPASMRIDMSIV